MNIFTILNPKQLEEFLSYLKNLLLDNCEFVVINETKTTVRVLVFPK